MSALEQEILEKVRSLNEAQQQQVLHYIQEIQPKPFDFDQWRKEVEAFRAELAAKDGKDHVFGYYGKTEPPSDHLVRYLFLHNRSGRGTTFHGL